MTQPSYDNEENHIRSPSPSSPASFNLEASSDTLISSLKKYSDSFSEIQDDESYFADPDYGYYYDPELCTHLGPQPDPEKFHYEEIYKKLRKIPHLQKQIKNLEDKLLHSTTTTTSSSHSSTHKRKRNDIDYYNNDQQPSNSDHGNKPTPINLALLPFNYITSNKINIVLLLSGVYLFVTSYFCLPSGTSTTRSTTTTTTTSVDSTKELFSSASENLTSIKIN